MHWTFTHHLARLLTEAFFSTGKRKLHPRILGYSYEEMSTNSISNFPIGMRCNISDLCKHIWLQCFTCVQLPTHWSCTHHIARLLTGIYFYFLKRRKRKKHPPNFGHAYEQMYTNFNQFYLFQFSMQKLRTSQNCASTSCSTASPSFNHPSTGASRIILHGC